MSEASGARRAGRLFAEGVVVLASILIAFALDAAWDNSELARELDQDLQSVASEIEANIEQARFHVALDGRIVAAAQKHCSAHWTPCPKVARRRSWTPSSGGTP